MHLRTVTIERDGDIAWVIVNNPPVNATSTAVRAGLLDAVKEVQDCRLAILKCVGRTFIAGGNMSEFDSPPVEPHLPEVVNAIEDSETPFLALLHGNVLGGGFEIAMACRYRFAAPGTKFGLPEVKVGLIAGAGGTQRLPRLLGWDTAIQMACFGKLKTAEELIQTGAIDGIHDDLYAAANIFALSQKREHQQAPVIKVSQRELKPLSADEITAKGELILKAAKGQKAPIHNWQALQWATKPFEKGQPLERALHLKLRKSEESKALRHIFFAQRAVTKPSRIEGVKARIIKKIAIVGGGLMGCGIASACLNGGFEICLIEQNEEAATKASKTVSKLMLGALERGKISQEQFTKRMAGFSVHTSYAAAAESDLAIEAVYEDLNAKQEVFGELEKVVSRDCILATNTSYLDPNLIFTNIINLETCVGIHFFSPAHIMKLVEIVHADQTSDEVLASAFSFTKKIGKISVLSGVCDGFIGNRILTSYRRAAEYLLADGALPFEIDEAMRAFGMAMGPFEAQDLSGLQIAQANRVRQEPNRDASERYVTISDQLCALGRFGQRNGKGWYQYIKGDSKPNRDPDVEALILKYSSDQKIERKSFSISEIQSQLLTAMANEGACIVEEGIAENDAAIDAVKIFGYGFPNWQGGPMYWSTHAGKKTISATLLKLETASPNSWKRATRFQ